MPPNTSPIFPDAAICGVAQLTVANTARDGTGTVAVVYTPGVDGGRVDLVRVQAQVTTTAGAIRIFVHDGTNFRLIKELLVAAVTPSVSLEAWSGEWRPTVPLVLPTGYSLRASTNNAEAANAFAHGGDF